MKKTISFLLLFLLVFFANAQWTNNGNGITTYDNVGIGTTNPQHKLEIYGANNAIGVGLTNYGWTNTNLIGAEYGTWDNSRTNAAGTYFYRWTGTGTTYHLGYIGQDNNNGHWGLAFKTDSENSKTHATSTRMFINTTGNVGIGTTSPTGKLEILKNADLSSSITLPNSGLIIRADNDGNDASLRFGVDNTNLKALIQTQQTTTAAKFDLLLNPFGGNVGIGTTTPDAKLAVNGNIHTKEVKVDLVGWPDFVFEKEYNLPSLEEVETHIAENGHLQNIPSAKEVAEYGVKLGEMNAKLLQKIEELMLYTIQQEKKIEILESRLESIESNTANNKNPSK